MSLPLLERELGSLHRRVRDWSPARWRAGADDPAALRAALATVGADGLLTGSRAEVAYALVVGLARWSRAAGLPVTADPPRLGDHALADQLAVVGRELLAAPRAGAVATAALGAVAAARTALDGSRPPADVSDVTG